MRILYFTRDYTPHDYRFLKTLAQSGYHVGYLRLERGEYPLEDRPLPVGIESIQWAGGRRRVSWRDGLRLVSDLKRVIRDFKPDLIQAGPIQRSAFLVALTGFQPLVSMSWGYDLLIDAKRNRWWQWATRFALERSAAMVGDSEIVRRKAIEHGMLAERIVIFPWGVDISHFTPGGGDGGIRQRLGWNEDHFVLLSTRSWAPIYGVEELARAFVRAARRCPQLCLLMLGNGPQAPLIQHIFGQGEVLDRVHFPGQVSEAELPNYYRAADLYVSASHSDGTSISLLEALACGCPVLVSDIPGNREWIEDGVQGWLFSDGDVDALECSILIAFEQRAQLSSMGITARDLAKMRAEWEQNSKKLIKAYELVYH